MKLNMRRIVSYLVTAATVITTVLTPLTAYAGSYQAVAEKTYEIQNVGTGLYLDCNGQEGKLKKQSNIQIYKHTPGNKTQSFEVKKRGENKYSLISSDNNKLVINLDTNSNKPKAGTNANLWTYTGHVSQTWGFWSVDGAADTFYICSSANDQMVLGVDGKKSLSNVSLKQYKEGDKNQQWKFVEVKKPEPVKGSYDPKKMVAWASDHLEQDRMYINDNWHFNLEPGQTINSEKQEMKTSQCTFVDNKGNRGMMCARFVSKCLINGGYGMKNEIAGAKDLYNHLHNSSCWKESKSIVDARVGDVVFYDKNADNYCHCGIITSGSGRDAKVSAHTAWAMDYPLNKVWDTKKYSYKIVFHYIGE